VAAGLDQNPNAASAQRFGAVGTDPAPASAAQVNPIGGATL
jgi:hypothetical protein